MATTEQAVVVTESRDLDALVTRINEEHRSCREAFQRGLEYAINAGKLLVEAKLLVGHGQWLPWLEKNFEGSERLAQGYMRAAREWGLPEGRELPQHVADLSFRNALSMIQTAKANTYSATPERRLGRLVHPNPVYGTWKAWAEFSRLRKFAVPSIVDALPRFDAESLVERLPDDIRFLEALREGLEAKLSEGGQR